MLAHCLFLPAGMYVHRLFCSLLRPEAKTGTQDRSLVLHFSLGPKEEIPMVPLTGVGAQLPWRPHTILAGVLALSLRASGMSFTPSPGPQTWHVGGPNDCLSKW